MGLLFHNLSNEFSAVADRVYESHFKEDPELEKEYDQRRKKRMYEDILHNLSFLEVAYTLDDEKIFRDYSLWLLKLMIYLMPDLKVERIKDQMVMHYKLLEEALKDTLEKETFTSVKPLLDKAIELTEAYELEERKSLVHSGKYAHIKETYFRYLKDKKAKRAVAYIKEVSKQGIPLEDLYVDVLQEVMSEIGDLWQERLIGVDEEHYMTSITQMAMSQFYEVIFSNESNGRTAVICSVGSELHEMGGRMVSDMLSLHGWETSYLGAAVPKQVILDYIETNRPEALMLSVTMPHHLLECRDIVLSVKEAYPDVLVGVGGRAFNMMDNVRERWNVDIYASDAKALLELTKKEVTL